MSTCRDCHATIRFVHVADAAIPVDPIPNEAGNVAARPQGSTLIGYRVTKARPLEPGYRVYMPHRAACRTDKARVLAKDRTPTLPL